MKTPALDSQPVQAATVRKQPRSKRIEWLVSLALFVLTGVVIWNMPHGYSMDLSKIGKGQDVVVLVHDHSVANSYELMRTLDHVRADYHRHVDFLVADLGTSVGQKFATEQGVEPASLVLFAADGSRLLTIYGLKSPEHLRLTFDRTFGHRTARR